jgi:hypothetical protein
VGQSPTIRFEGSFARREDGTVVWKRGYIGPLCGPLAREIITCKDFAALNLAVRGFLGAQSPVISAAIVKPHVLSRARFTENFHPIRCPEFQG